MFGRMGLVGKFAVRSGIFVLGIAVVLAFTALYVNEQTHLRMSAETAQLTANAAVSDELATMNLNAPLDAASRRHMDTLAATLRQQGVFAVKLWGLGGQLLYSSNPSDPLGKSFGGEEDIREALDGELAVEVKHGADDESANQFAQSGSLIEVYAPLRVGSDGRVAGAFEMYRSYATVVADARRSSLLLLLVIILGTIPAYFAQLALVKQASDDLDCAEAERIELRDSLELSLNNLEEQLVGTLQALTATVDAKDSYTASHALNVTRYATEMGRRLGADDEALASLERAGLLHDIGKIGVPEAILLKQSSLTAQEFELVKTHAELGARIIETIPALADICETVRHHHERWDGRGYPDGIAGAQLSQAARILAVADAFDAMTTDRPYRRAMRLSAARCELANGRGTQFDPDCVDALLAALSDLGLDMGRRKPAAASASTPSPAGPAASL